MTHESIDPVETGRWPGRRTAVIDWLVNGTRDERFLDRLIPELCRRLEAAGVKTLVKDLEHLKKLIQDEKPKGDQIKKLLAKLGKETVTFAGRSEGKNAEKAKALGEALAHMADEKGDAEAE